MVVRLIEAMSNLPQKTRVNIKISLFKALKARARSFISGFVNKKVRKEVLSAFPGKVVRVPKHKKTVLVGTFLTMVIALAITTNLESSFAVTRQLDSLIIIPTEVSGIDWSRTENTLVQDVSEDAVYQNFSKNNSSHFAGGLFEPTSEYVAPPVFDEVPKEQQETSSTTEETLDNEKPETTLEDAEEVSAEDPDNPGDTGEEISDSDSENEDEDEVQPVEDVEIDPTPTEEISDETPLEAMSRGFFRFVNRATSVLPFVQESIVELVVADENENPAESSGPDLAPSEIQEPLSNILTEDGLDTEGAGPTTPSESEEFTETEVATSTEPVVASTDSDKKTQTESEDIKATSPDNEIIFSDFAFPALNSGQFIKNTQLRISLAGLAENKEGDTIPTIDIEYLIDDSWTSAGVILIDGEISNALNGGYFLFAMPHLKNVSELEDFAVRLSYNGDKEILDSIYIDSLWLQINTETFDRDILDNRLKAYLSALLNNSEMHEHLLSRFDFNRKELPRFELQYQPQRNVAARFLGKIFRNKLAEVSSVKVLHNGSTEVYLDPNIAQTSDGLWTIQFVDSDNTKMHPGQYTVELTIEEGGKTFTDSFDFQWGMLTVNPDQTEYELGDEAHISLGALAPSGNTLCDANLTLYIIDPVEFIHNVDVKQSGLCNGNNVVDAPDYDAFFTPTEIGEHEMYIESLDNDGNVISHTSDTFHVVNTHPISIRRVGPTRIFPPSPYPMVITIDTDEAFEGTLTEKVPGDFEITNTNADTVRQTDGYHELSWDVDLNKGDSALFLYTFDAPDVSPYLYELGPATLSGDIEGVQIEVIENLSTTTVNSTSSIESASSTSVEIKSKGSNFEFTEHRRWQIASDAAGRMLILWDDDLTTPAGWTCVSCTGGDDYYQKFLRGSSTVSTSTLGSATHTHTVDGNVDPTGSTGTGPTFGSGGGITPSHSHTFTPSVTSSNNLPSYRQLRVLRNNSAGDPTTLPAGAILIFDTAVPTGWTRYSAQDGYFARGEGTSGTTGGADTHTHPLGGTIAAASGATYGTFGNTSPQADDDHTHTISTTSPSSDHRPPYIEVVLGELDSATNTPEGIISMFDGDLPLGWVTRSDDGDPFNGNFFVGSTTYGGTGGAENHTHTNVSNAVSGGVSGTNGAWDGTGGVPDHTHAVDYSNFSIESNLPPYADVIIAERVGINPQYDQNYFRWYVNEDNQTPTDPWPIGVDDLLENESITSTSTHVADGDIVRLRMSINVSLATSTAGDIIFKLQYGEGSNCSAISSWNDLGDDGGGEIWRGYNNSSETDGSTLSSTTLSVSDIFGTYEEENDSATTPSDIDPGQDMEFDWVIQHNNATSSTEYCFRMVQDDDAILDSYSYYPTLYTNAAPNSPTLNKLFDNEKTASTSPWFEFYTDDDEGNDVTYQIQVDNDYSFGSVVIDKNTEDHSDQFENLVTTSDKDPYNVSETIRFTSETTLTNDVTYWWHVRAKDPDGSNAWGVWSNARSFTIDTALTETAWFQTTEEQFDTDILDNTESLVTDAVDLLGASANGTTSANGIDFDDGSVGNAWGELSWNDTETSGDIKYRIQYLTGTSTWLFVPDGVLSGNQTGFDASPVSLINLDTDTYNEIRVVGMFTDSGGSPSLQDWTINWGYRIPTPVITRLFPNEKIGTTTPTFEFATTDPQDDDLTYEISWSTAYDFSASTTRVSDTHAGFINTNDGGDADPFISGDDIEFTIQGADALTNNTTYWWKIRATDPNGSAGYSFWTEARSLTVDTTIAVSTWFQTTDEQFDTDILSGTQSSGPGNDEVEVATTSDEALIVYGELSVNTPRFRTWDGATLSGESSALNVDASSNYLVVKEAPTREEYVLATMGTDGDINAQVYAIGAWGDLQEMTSSASNSNTRGFDVVYETTSGDAIVAYCDGDADPGYYVWDGDSWTSGGTINLATTNDCEWIKMASDPNGDEIILVSNDSTGSQYEAQVWNGSSWGNSMTMGGMSENPHEGMDVLYEDSGGQGIVVSSNDNGNNFAWNSWNGSSWAGASTQGLGDDFENGRLARDDGTDNMALCYVDNDRDIGVIRWNGSSWTGQVEHDTSWGFLTDPDDNRPTDCIYEKEGSRDGYLMHTYSDTTNARYRSWNGSSWGGENSVNTIQEGEILKSERAGDNKILTVVFDSANTRYDFSYWNGTTWSTYETLEDSPTVSATPWKEPFSIAPRGSASEGTITVTPSIKFTEGLGPYWDEALWSDTAPGTSDILYQVQYLDGDSWEFIPNSDISGNETGTTTSPIDLSGLSVSTYDEIRLYATLTCNAGDCPTLQDWTVTWAEGITVAGTLQEFNQATNVTSGTVGVAVNGSLQAGKTGVVSGGTWSISNVTVFPGDIVTVFVSGATDDEEAVGVTRYDGTGDINGLQMYELHLTLGSNDATSTSLTNSDIGVYDKDDDEDVFIDLTGTTLTLCGDVSCGQSELYINASTTYQPKGILDTHDIEINGTFLPNGNTVYVGGSWDNNATSTAATSTIIFYATTTSETIDSTGATLALFNNVTFGSSTSISNWSLTTALDIDGDLAVNEGVLSRGLSEISVAGDLSTGLNGSWTGVGTTTFDGNGTSNWSDAHLTPENVGKVVIDGSSKTISLAGNVAAESVSIGADDILSASASDYDITVYQDWINNNTFLAQQGTVFFGATSTNKTIIAGGDSFYDLTFNGVGGAWSFSEANLSVTNNFTVSTGTVTMPTGTTTLSGSFSSVGGTFSHNNATLLMTSGGVETLAASGTPFTNAFYNLTFNGSGSWTFTDTNATTSNDFRIQSGTATFPSGELSIGGSLVETGGGFNHGNGTVKFISAAQGNLVDPDNSSFNNLTFDGPNGGWSLPASNNMTVLGDFTIASGTATSTSGTLFVGGSWNITAGVGGGTSAAPEII